MEPDDDDDVVVLQSSSSSSSSSSSHSLLPTSSKKKKKKTTHSFPSTTTTTGTTSATSNANAVLVMNFETLHAQFPFTRALVFDANKKWADPDHQTLTKPCFKAGLVNHQSTESEKARVAAMFRECELRGISFKRPK